MKITHSNFQSEGMALAWQRTRQESKLNISSGSPPPRPQIPQADLSSEGIKTQQAEAASETDKPGMDSRLKLLVAVIEAITGRKVELFDPAQLEASGGASPASGTNAPPNDSAADEQEWSVRVETSQIRDEFELSAYQAKGQVTTADGRSIDFSLELLMQRYEREETSVVVEANNKPKATDPLVLNLTTDQVRLQAGSWSFDLNTDGQEETLPGLSSGSAWLAIDRNGNDTIDNGSELFGPGSGNGFSELAALDEDGNGWIDEADSGFALLRAWSPGGKPQTLAEAGVGAIALEHRNTPFSVKNQGETLGLVRSSGVFLTEDGKARSIQQVDLIV